MKQLLKEIKKNTLYQMQRNWFKNRKQKKKFVEWEKSGRPVPPPHVVKQRTLRDFAKRFDLKIMVETGTCKGYMVEAMKKDFDQIFSIELSKALYEKVKKKFEGEEKIVLLQGDSAVELKGVVNRIDQPALFWLDGHYSAGDTAKGEKDTPIYEELEHIFNSQDRGHVIIIDDARCFGTEPSYPSIKELSDFVRLKRPNVNIAVEDDSIRITPINVAG